MSEPAIPCLAEWFVGLRFGEGGSYLTNEAERKEAIALLRDMRRTAGWQTDQVIQELERQWSHNLGTTQAAQFL